jgi:hypothetical protein
MDLLLSEHAMIVAKESAAAINHSDEYTGYASLLALNSADLSGLIGRALGNTASVQFAQSWNAQNTFLVDYAIGVVTHNDDKTKGASTSLSATFTPQFAQFVSTLTKVPRNVITELTSTQVMEEIAFIDDVFAGDFKAYYADLHRAYSQTSRFGDLVAEAIAAEFPDKFPGDPTDHSVDARVMLNMDLQEHSYLATLATDAALNHRDSERTPALGALNTNADALRTIVEDPRFALAWSQETSALQTYALSADPKARDALTTSVVSELASVTRATPGVIGNHETATIKVVDDQRSKTPSVADDDRAAATSMQPIADSAE